MEDSSSIDLAQLAKHVDVDVATLQTTIELLDEGNTVPFIARFRRDQTGGLDELRIRTIQRELARFKQLHERKASILKSIESRQQLTPELRDRIQASKTMRVLEDLYLPYKPRKKSLAHIARSRGLAPLAEQIFAAQPGAASIQDVAAGSVDAENELADTDAVLTGVRHLLAEQFCNAADLRSLLRRHMWQNGHLVSKKMDEPEESDGEEPESSAQADESREETKPDLSENAEPSKEIADDSPQADAEAQPDAGDEAIGPTLDSSENAENAQSSENEPGSAASGDEPIGDAEAVPVSPEAPATPVETSVTNPAESSDVSEASSEEVASEGSLVAADPAPEVTTADSEETQADPLSQSTADSDQGSNAESTPQSDLAAAEVVAATEDSNTPQVEGSGGQASEKADLSSDPEGSGSNDAGPSTELSSPSPAPEATAPQEVATGSDATQEKSPSEGQETKQAKKAKAAAEAREKKKAIAREQRRATRRRRRERLVQSFKDYFDFRDPLGKLPHHRILAINRGERTKVLRVKIECEQWDKLSEKLQEKAIPQDHPYAEFLRECLHDALHRLLVPTIEREVRRELNDRAEEHAVKVFAKNLRQLLLQPPLSGHRVIAIDPGFRSGCKVVALDEFGNLLGHTFINLLGKDQQREQGRQELAKFTLEHRASVIAVGNGAACRETENLVGELLANELKDTDVGYLIVNEAGTSVYSTSELGREELPDVDPTVMSAVSIGRRALDPLSELVKIDPASIGVGLYQHDVKAKHLRESLDDVVESCVNYVGVDVNSASPSLLRYVSGLNKMTANQIYKHREQNGPFKTREELKAVSGIGESSYIQAAGFLKINQGANSLDGTWIHPESYAVAERILAAIGFAPSDLSLPNTTIESTATEAPAEAKSDQVSSVPPEESSDSGETDTESPKVPTPTEDVASEATSGETSDSTNDGPSESTAEDQSDAPRVESSPESPAAAGGESADKDVASSEAAVTTPTASPAASQPAEKPVTAASQKQTELHTKLSGVDVGRLAPQLGVGKLLLQDILTALARPGRDPREDLPSPPFRRGVLKLEDLKPGMELSGTVLNVVDFGAFVDIGLVDSGLIHVSRLADKYVSDPHEVVSVGDILRVWVVEVDTGRRRVSLTAIEPGTERPKKEREARKPRESRDKQQSRGSGQKSEGQRSGGQRAGGGRKRRDDRRGAKKGRAGDEKPKEYRAKSKPKPFVPITKEMEDGKEPLRTFGDLKQLFEKKKNKGKG